MKASDSPTGKRRFRSWQKLRRVVIGVAWTATIIALLYAVENWRCRRAWEKYRGEAEARGQHFYFDYFVPKPIPYDRNFAMAGPILQSIFDKDPNRFFRWHDNFAAASRSGVELDKPVFESRFHFMDLGAWEKALAKASATRSRWNEDDRDPAFGPEIHCAPDPDPAANAAAAPGVLRGLEDSTPILDELRAASSRPEARYPIDWYAANPAMIALPHYGQLQLAISLLRLRATAELALGKNDDALNDLKLMFYLNDTTKHEPIPIGGLVRMGNEALEAQVIWEGLERHSWTDAELQQIQDWLASRDFVTEAANDLSPDAAVSVKIAEYYRTQKDFGTMVDEMTVYGIGNDARPQPKVVFLLLNLLVPKGWFALEELNRCKSADALYQSVIDAGARRIDARRLEENAKERGVLPRDPLSAVFQHRLLETMMDFGTTIVRRFAGAQCMEDEAAIACGLERYWLVHGEYPTELGVLAPEYMAALPHDVLTGEDYRYRRDSAQLFTLYSVGWDLKDDGGTRSEKRAGETGDWVW